jgi:O-antigen/teichoic acid export membrane protein
LARNTGFNLLGLGLPLLVALVALPVLLARLGPERFGLLSLAWMLIALVGEVGLGRAVTRFVAEGIARGQGGVVRAVVRTSAVAQTALALGVGTTAALLTPWLVGVLDLPDSLVPEARAVFLVVAATLPLAMIASLLRGVLEAAQRFGVVNGVRFTVSTVSYLLPLLAVWVGWGIVPIVILLLAVRIAAAVAYGLLAAGQLRGLARATRADEPPPPALGVLIRFGGWVTVATLLTPLLLSIDRFLLGALVSVAAVGVYTAPYELVLRLVLIPGSLAATLFPAFSSLQGTERREELGRLLARSSRYVLAVVGSVVALLVAGAEPLLVWWLGGAYTADAATALRWLGPGVLAASLAQVPFSLLQGVGRADVPGKLYLLELPAVAAVAWLLVTRWGIAGAAAAWSARAVLEAAVLFLAARRLAPGGSTSGEAWRSTATGVCLVAAAVVAWAGIQAAGTTTAAMGALAAAAGGLTLLLWRVALEPGERRVVRRLLAGAAT